MFSISLSNKLKKFVIMLILVEIVTIFLMIKSYNNKPIPVILDEVVYKKIEPKEIKYSILLQSGEEYIESVTFPTEGYVYDEDKSGCVDENGEKIFIKGQNILSYNSNLRKVELLTDNTEYCYIYFNEEN